MIQADITGSAGPSTLPAGGSTGGGFTPDSKDPSYFQFFQTRQNCEDFNLYPPGVVHYAADIACTPPFLVSPGTAWNIGWMVTIERNSSVARRYPCTASVGG